MRRMREWKWWEKWCLRDSMSRNGKYFAYGVSASGSDWETIHIRNVEANKVRFISSHLSSSQLFSFPSFDYSLCFLQEFEEVLEWVKYSSISWTHDERGFFYSHYDKPHNTQSNHFLILSLILILSFILTLVCILSLSLTFIFTFYNWSHSFCIRFVLFFSAEKVLNQKLYYHYIGTEQSQDILIYQNPNEPVFLSSILFSFSLYLSVLLI
jgi:protease II